MIIASQICFWLAIALCLIFLVASEVLVKKSGSLPKWMYERKMSVFAIVIALLVISVVLFFMDYWG